MDLWPAYIDAVSGHVEYPEFKICFDRFHVAKHLGDGPANREDGRSEVGNASSAGGRVLDL